MSEAGVQVSVVIPLYNDAATIGAVLDGLAAQAGAPPFEVIVVDDGSSDGGGGLVGARARVIRQPNAGPAAARNQGARDATGEIVLFLDADCVPPPNWVADMVHALATGRFDAVMGTIGMANDGIVPRLVQSEIDDRYRGMAVATGGVDFIAAPACGFRRDVFLALGGFDERLRHAEDVEIAYRVTAAGHRIAFVDTAPAAHAHQTTWGQFIATKFRRAVGRFTVFRLFPGKRRHDTWTPMPLKLQFAATALAVPLALLGLVWQPWLLAATAALVVVTVLLGWPLVRETGRGLSDLTGLPGGLVIGAFYVVLRSLIILAALAAMKLTPDAMRPTPEESA